MIGRNIRKIRLSKGIKQCQLAKMAHISGSYLSDIEKGRSIPSIKTLIRLADVLQIDCSELLSQDYIEDNIIKDYSATYQLSC